MIVHDLGPGALARIVPRDLSAGPPPSPFEPFEFHGCTCGVASFIGQPPWELHVGADEILHVLAGSTRLTVREPGGEQVHTLKAGDLAVVPKGCWHRNDAPDGVTVFHMTPTGDSRNSWDDPCD